MLPLLSALQLPRIDTPRVLWSTAPQPPTYLSSLVPLLTRHLHPSLPALGRSLLRQQLQGHLRSALMAARGYGDYVRRNLKVGGTQLSGTPGRKSACALTLPRSHRTQLHAAQQCRVSQLHQAFDRPPPPSRTPHVCLCLPAMSLSPRPATVSGLQVALELVRDEWPAGPGATVCGQEVERLAFLLAPSGPAGRGDAGGWREVGPNGEALWRT